MATLSSTGVRDDLVSSRRRASGSWTDSSFRVVALGAGLSVLAILALITFFTTKQAWPIFSHDAWGFISGTRWDPTHNTFGALPFIYGTAVASGIALVLAVPLSFGIALFTNEVAPRRLRRPVIYLVDLLAAIPSVVYGLWALAVLVNPARDVYQWISDTIGKIPVLDRVFGGVPSGRSFATAGIVLAIMMIPIVTAISREVLATVSQDDKNAALAMGATRWEMLRACVFPRVRSGLVGAVMLGMGRALGETIAVALVIGSNQKIDSHIFHSGDSMASVIAHEFGEAAATPRYKAALIGLAVLLFVFTLIVNVLARWITNRAERRAAL
jgi:phosphate transport system permease protein